MAQAFHLSPLWLEAWACEHLCAPWGHWPTPLCFTLVCGVHTQPSGQMAYPQPQ